MASKSPAEIKAVNWGDFEIRGPVHLFRERLLLRCFQAMLQEGRVLDAGSGSGSLSRALCTLGYRVEGVELSAQFARQLAGEKAKATRAGRLSATRASITHLPFAAACFDGLICGEVLEHILPEMGGDQAVVAEFHRVLKPGAPCVVSVPLNPDLWDHSDEWAGHVKRYKTAELEKLFSDAGFKVEGWRTWGFPLGRAYHSLLFAPWLSRQTMNSSGETQGKLGVRAAGNRLAVEMLAAAFRFDELFARTKRGRGVVLWARS